MIKKDTCVDILMFLYFVSFLIITYYIVSPFILAFFSGVETFLVNELAFALTIIFFTAFFIDYFLNYFIKRKKSKKPNRWIRSTLFIIIITIILGSIIIIHYFGETKIDLALRNSDNMERIGNITCEDASGKIIVDHEIICKIYPNLKDKSGTVFFKMDDGTDSQQDFSELRFIAPYSVNYVLFKINGTDENDNYLRLEIGHPIKFYTEEESEKRKEQYLAYIIGLIAAVLFSVPTMMVRFKKLIE